MQAQTSYSGASPKKKEKEKTEKDGSDAAT